MRLSAQETKVESWQLEGETLAHDPSTIWAEGGRYYLFYTGRGIGAKLSPDLIRWSEEPSVFSTAPAWALQAVPGYRGHTWAPDVARLDGRFHL